MKSDNYKFTIVEDPDSPGDFQIEIYACVQNQVFYLPMNLSDLEALDRVLYILKAKRTAKDVDIYVQPALPAPKD